MYILTLFILAHGSLAGISTEYDNKGACDYAKVTHHQSVLASKDPNVKIVFANCTPKNPHDVAKDYEATK